VVRDSCTRHRSWFARRGPVRLPRSSEAPAPKRCGVITRAVLFEEFAGRAEELAFLVNFRSRSGREARGGTVVIAGDSGVGKTRLLHEFRRAIERDRGGTAFVRCDEAQGRPYGPLIEALEQIATARSSWKTPSSSGCNASRRYARRWKMPRGASDT